MSRSAGVLGRAGLASTGALGLLTGATPALAHGFGQRYDLPVPLWLWVTGAAAAVALSFVVIGLFVRGTDGLESYPRLNLLQWRLGRCLAHKAVQRSIKLVSVGLFALIITASAVGNQNPIRNLAPTMIWVIWWVGFAYVSALLGNFWMLANPWKILFGWIEALFHRGGPDWKLAVGLPYPPWLGVWPAIVLFLGFAWAELVFIGRTVPAQLALMTIVYSLITWAGMALFGRVVWLRYGDPFAVAFGLLARFAPTEVRVTDPEVCQRCPVNCRDGAGECINCDQCFTLASESRREWNLRPFAAGLLRTGDVSASMLAFVLVMLSTVTFDGFTATPAWTNLESTLYRTLRALGPGRLTIIETMGLLAFPALFFAVYSLFATWMAGAGGGQRSIGAVARAFVLSLVPIAIAYHLAHYFTYLLIQGQLVIPLASDPFGFGWNFLGTRTYRPNIGVVGARFAWYTAVIAIVLGHIIAVYVAHVIALREFGDRRAALRSQYSMLVLMVGYTMVSLWIIAQPIVETTPKG